MAKGHVRLLEEFFISKTLVFISNEISSGKKAKSTLKCEIPDIKKALIAILEVYILISLLFIV